MYKNGIISNKILSFIFGFMIIISLFLVIGATAATELLKISDVTIKEKSTTVSGSITDVSNDEIDNSFIFHKVGDYVIYKITIQNNKSDIVTINNISDDNNNSYIEYEYDKHEKETISGNGKLEFIVKAIYKNEVTDITACHQRFWS